MNERAASLPHPLKEPQSWYGDRLAYEKSPGRMRDLVRKKL